MSLHVKLRLFRNTSKEISPWSYATFGVGWFDIYIDQTHGAEGDSP